MNTSLSHCLSRIYAFILCFTGAVHTYDPDSKMKTHEHNIDLTTIETLAREPYPPVEELTCFIDSTPEATYATDIAGKTALHIASERGNSIVTRKLIEYGSDITCQDMYGATPLHAALHTYLRTTTHNLACDHDTETDIQNTSYHNTQTHHNDRQTTAQVLLECGADLHQCDEDDTTPQDVIDICRMCGFNINTIYKLCATAEAIDRLLTYNENVIKNTLRRLQHTPNMAFICKRLLSSKHDWFDVYRSTPRHMLCIQAGFSRTTCCAYAVTSNNILTALNIVKSYFKRPSIRILLPARTQKEFYTKLQEAHTAYE